MSRKKKLERDTVAAANALLRKGRCRVVYIFCAEEDGEAPNGVNYCIHGVGDAECQPLLKQAVEVMSAANSKVWERFTGGR